MKVNFFSLLSLILVYYLPLKAQVDKSDWLNGFPDGCTSITVGRLATVDGSVITSHTDDSHRTESSIDIIPAHDYGIGSLCPVYKRTPCDTMAMPVYIYIKTDDIPQIAHTNGFINTAYPCLNDHQLAIGESTFGGREVLQSENGLIDCEYLCQIMLERCSTAREAIKLADELTTAYGWIDPGECLTLADKKEVWHFEIVGPGKGKKGSIWAAQRVPDDHIAVNANASRIRMINLKDPDYYMASANIFTMAIDSGWCTSKKEFEFCYAYAPESRTSFASRRREWRVFDLLAPSLKLDPNAENFPFSIKPDHPVSLEKLVTIFKDYYEGTPFDMTKDITVTNEKGMTVISPLANPFMPYDMNKMFKINGGWGWLGERTIARWYTMYATIIQCRDWLPDEIGGVAWIALDNVATSIYIPIYCGVNDLPQSYKTPGRARGFTRESAWWAFNYLGTLTAQRWGDMRHDVEAAWDPWQKELFDNQKKIEQQALDLYNQNNPVKTKNLLTGYTNDWGNKVVKKAWETGDFLWTKYDEKF
jgi:dipeptidase